MVGNDVELTLISLLRFINGSNGFVESYESLMSLVGSLTFYGMPFKPSR